MTWRTVKSLMLSGWEWEVSSPLQLSYRVCEKDEVEMFGTSMPWGQAALVLGVMSVGYQWMLQLLWVSFKSTSGFRLLATGIILQHLHIFKAARSFHGSCSQNLGSNGENYNFGKHFCSARTEQVQQKRLDFAMKGTGSLF